MKWIKSSENSDPSITKWYIVRTDSHAGRCYCDNKNALKRYCHLNNINLNEVEWLDESELSIKDDILERAAREFYWKRNPDKIIAENSRPDMVIGYVEGFKAALKGTI